jgi:hypothetical protein
MILTRTVEFVISNFPKGKIFEENFRRSPF